MRKRKLDLQPLKVNKNLVIRSLRERPEDVGLIFPDGRFKTAAEAIAALEAHPGTWVIDGVLKADQ